MRPAFNSLPHQSNPCQTNGTSNSAAQQVMPPNQCQGNPGNLMPNSGQIQSQVGMMNPQMGIPFNNSNTHFSNGTMTMPNGGMVQNSSTCFMNPPNHFLPFQNMVPHMGSPSPMSNPGQYRGGFGQNLNTNAGFQVQGMNSVQNLNPNAGFQVQGMNSAHNLNPNAGFQVQGMNSAHNLNPNAGFQVQGMNSAQNLNPNAGFQMQGMNSAQNLNPNAGFQGQGMNSAQNLNPNAGFQVQGMNSAQNLNPNAGFQVQGMNSVQNMNGMNPSQLQGQLFSHAAMNMPQFMNQNVAMPNGQFCYPSPMPNMNQFVQMQMPNYPQPQIVPCNINVRPNQVAQNMGPQNPMFIANQQFGLMQPNGAVQPGNKDEHKFVPSMVDVNALKQTMPPNNTIQSQGNSSAQPPFGPARPHQTQNLNPFGSKSQESPGNDGGKNNSNNKWPNSRNRKFTRNQNADAGSHKSQHVNNAKEKFGFHNAHGRKGGNDNGARKFGEANSSNQTGVERRTLCLNYTEQEIKQWREERKKNFPSKANIEKKVTGTQTEPEISDKLRRQQLKEILAKQAELGCEVAEIPSSYLSDSEKQANRGEENNGFLTRKERFQNKRGRGRGRGRFRQNDRFAKKQRFADNDSGNANDQNNNNDNNNDNNNNQLPEKLQQVLAENGSNIRATTKREPTLLEKLLSADMKRDKSYLLQVFRFMVINSFFKDLPDTPLKFPVVVVKEIGREADVAVVEQKPEKLPLLENGIANPEKMIDSDRDDDNDDDDLGSMKIVEVVPEEEEGEIID